MEAQRPGTLLYVGSPNGLKADVYVAGRIEDNVKIITKSTSAERALVLLEEQQHYTVFVHAVDEKRRMPELVVGDIRIRGLKKIMKFIEMTNKKNRELRLKHEARRPKRCTAWLRRHEHDFDAPESAKIGFG